MWVIPIDNGPKTNQFSLQPYNQETYLTYRYVSSNTTETNEAIIAGGQDESDFKLEYNA